MGSTREARREGRREAMAARVAEPRSMSRRLGSLLRRSEFIALLPFSLY